MLLELASELGPCLRVWFVRSVQGGLWSVVAHRYGLLARLPAFQLCPAAGNAFLPHMCPESTNLLE